MTNEGQIITQQDARPFLRNGTEKSVIMSADSGTCSGACGSCDSGACSGSAGSSGCGTGGGECGHVPALPKTVSV